MRNSSNWSDVRRFLGGLSLHQQGMLLRAFAVLVGFKVLLRICPFRWFLPRPAQHQPAVGPVSDKIVAEWVWAVSVVSSRIHLNFTCLVQALSLKWLLRAYPDLRVHIGVHKSKTDAFSAHAWVTYQNQVILGGNTTETFAPILNWK